MAMVPREGPKQTPVSNDINSLAAVALCCLGHFWWPLWWTQVGSHSRLKRPRYLWFLMVFKSGAKGRPLLLLLSDQLLDNREPKDNNKSASVRLLRMCFL